MTRREVPVRAGLSRGHRGACHGFAHDASPQRDATDVKRSPCTFPVDLVSQSFQDVNTVVALCEMREVTSVEEGRDVERVTETMRVTT